MHAIIDGKWKYLYNDWKEQSRLYDLESDRYTMNDLAAGNGAKVDYFTTKRREITTRIADRVNEMALHIEKPAISLDEKTQLHALGYIRK